MTDIIEIAKKAERDTDCTNNYDEIVFVLNENQLWKIEQLLREEFIKELGEPVGKVIRKTELTPHGNPMNVVDVLLYKTNVLGEVGTLLYALPKKG